MTTQKDLQKQINDLTNEHNFKALISETLPNIDTLAFLTGHDNEKKRLVARCKNTDEFKAVLAAFPATNENTVIGTATDKYYSNMATPYRLNIDNPCRPSQFNNFHLDISYKSGDVDVSCELPIDNIKEFTKTGRRNISDSEHHYFIGLSHGELANLQVLYYEFNCDNIRWYGGNRTANDEKFISEIISHLTA